MQFQRSGLPTVLCATVLSLSACSPDGPTTSPAQHTLKPRGAVTDASALVAQAMAGVRVRGEQDDMLRREAALPGFGGFYIDSLDQMVVYMKPGLKTPDALVRRVLVDAYSGRSERRIQELMPQIARAKIVPGDFTLSQLIAIENRISHSPVNIRGYTGVGTSLITNRVVVGFTDAESVADGVRAILSLGIPQKAVVAEVWGQITVSGSWDQANGVRPTRGGVRISVYNATTSPSQEMGCSHNFNARWHRPPPDTTTTDYIVTASHCATLYRGINGVTGDTVYQPNISLFSNSVGFVEVNQPWIDVCGNNPADSTRIDYCLDADAMLVRFKSGVTGERKVGTSVREGQNGDPGDMRINNWYPILGVVTPEWVSTTLYGVHKSGGYTGTTTGVIQLPATQVIARVCWTLSNCPFPGGRTRGRQIAYFNVVRVLHAGWGEGDSGGVVFAGNSSPYYALGMQVAGGGKRPTDTSVCTNGTSCSFYFVPWATIEQSAQAMLGPGTLNPNTAQ